MKCFCNSEQEIHTLNPEIKPTEYLHDGKEIFQTLCHRNKTALQTKAFFGFTEEKERRHI